jgi:hypothetical protein
VAQLVVIVEILLTERDGEQPLADQRRNIVFNQVRAPFVVKTCCKPIHHSDRSIVAPSSNAPASDVTKPASGLSSNRIKVAAAQRLSLIRSPDAPI